MARIGAGVGVILGVRGEGINEFELSASLLALRQYVSLRTEPAGAARDGGLLHGAYRAQLNQPFSASSLQAAPLRRPLRGACYYTVNSSSTVRLEVLGGPLVAASRTLRLQALAQRAVSTRSTLRGVACHSRRKRSPVPHGALGSYPLVAPRPALFGVWARFFSALAGVLVSLHSPPKQWYQSASSVVSPEPRPQQRRVGVFPLH